MRISFIIAVLVISCIAAFAVDVRYSTANDNIRVVVDIFENIDISAYTTKVNTRSVAVTIPELKIEEPVKLTVEDGLVTGITLENDADGNAVLTIALTDERRPSIFIIPFEEPADGTPAKMRLVIDIPRVMNNKTHERINENITRTTHEFTDYKYQIMEVLTISPGAQIKVAYSYSGETLMQILKRTNATAGINGGFFMPGPVPVGLLKNETGIITMPLLKRPVAAFDNNSVPSFFSSPTGEYSITVNNAAFTAQDWTEAIRSGQTVELKIITYASKITAPKNDICDNYIIKDGKIIDITKESYVLKEGEIVLNAIYNSAKKLSETVKIGDDITITPVIYGMDINNYAHVIAAGPKLITNGKANDLSKNPEKFQDDVLKGTAMRSAVAKLKNGNIIMVSTSRRISLADFTAYILRYGAVDALNLDGGGSSQIGAQSGLFNLPNGTYARPLASAIVVY